MCSCEHPKCVLGGNSFPGNGDYREDSECLYSKLLSQYFSHYGRYHIIFWTVSYVRSLVFMSSLDRVMAIFLCFSIASSTSVLNARLIGSNLSSSASNRQTSEWSEFKVNTFSLVPGKPRVADFLSTIICRSQLRTRDKRIGFGEFTIAVALVGIHLVKRVGRFSITDTTR